MDSEYKALIENNTWTLVKNKPDTNLIGTKWVFKIKKIQMRQSKDIKSG